MKDKKENKDSEYFANGIIKHSMSFFIGFFTILIIVAIFWVFYGILSFFIFDNIKLVKYTVLTMIVSYGVGRVYIWFLNKHFKAKAK